MASRDRKRQQFTGGHGQHFGSPKKVRNSSSKRAKIYLGNPLQKEQLRAKLANIFSPSKVPETTDPIDTDNGWMDVDDNDNDNDNGDGDGDDDTAVAADTKDNPESTTVPPSSLLKTKRRILPNAAGYHVYDKWKVIVPGQVGEYLRYTNATIGKPAGPGCPSEILRANCACGH